MENVVEINTAIAKEIPLRKFNFGDLPKLSKILRKMELKETVKKFFASPDKSKKSETIQEELGADLVATAITNLWMAEPEIYEFVAGLTDLTNDEVKCLEIEEMLNLFTKFAQNAGSVISFFKLAAK